jgi:hypothetical protein
LHAEVTIKGFYCNLNHLPEDEPLGLKHVEDIKKLKIKILTLKRCIMLVYILLFYSVKKSVTNLCCVMAIGLMFAFLCPC